MPRLQIQPRGLFPDISSGREPSNSPGGTFTHVAAGFPGALLKTAIEKFFQNSSTGNAIFGLKTRESFGSKSR